MPLLSKIPRHANVKVLIDVPAETIQSHVYGRSYGNVIAGIRVSRMALAVAVLKACPTILTRGSKVRELGIFFLIAGNSLIGLPEEMPWRLNADVEKRREILYFFPWPLILEKKNFAFLSLLLANGNSRITGRVWYIRADFPLSRALGVAIEVRVEV